MKTKLPILGLLVIGLLSCNSILKEKKMKRTETFPEVQIVGAMKKVMWKGELGSSINLDTISDKKGLFGLGPLSYLRGELLINDGKTYLSKVTSDSTMTVEETYNASAPFFVYQNISEWTAIELPTNLKTITDLEQFIDSKTTDYKRPFAFKLIGNVTRAAIHIQNLPEGTKVSSPSQAHIGQTTYSIVNEEVEIIGFFSKEHKGVFTHHDSFLHMHLITKDKSKMGHLDELELAKMKLYLPKK